MGVSGRKAYITLTTSEGTNIFSFAIPNCTVRLIVDDINSQSGYVHLSRVRIYQIDGNFEVNTNFTINMYCYDPELLYTVIALS